MICTVLALFLSLYDQIVLEADTVCVTCHLCNQLYYCEETMVAVVYHGSFVLTVIDHKCFVLYL